MIKLFITDLDGCISFPYISPDWDAANEIRTLVQQSKTDETIPPLTICSGRPLPDVEAVAQWLGVYKPMVFESGGGIYDMQNNVISWNPALNSETEEKLTALKAHLQQNYIQKIPGTVAEFSKRTDASLVNPGTELIKKIYAELSPYVEKEFPGFEIHKTDVSVNIISRKTNKSAGIRQLAGMLGITVDETAYIGDTGGDIKSLEMTGLSFAPVNAIPAVREIVQYPLEQKTTQAVLAAYKKIIKYNRTGVIELL